MIFNFSPSSKVACKKYGNELQGNAADEQKILTEGPKCYTCHFHAIQNIVRHCAINTTHVCDFER